MFGYVIGKKPQVEETNLSDIATNAIALLQSGETEAAYVKLRDIPDEKSASESERYGLQLARAIVVFERGRQEAEELARSAMAMNVSNKRLAKGILSAIVRARKALL